jgi:FkbM family methyltransferase
MEKIKMDVNNFNWGESGDWFRSAIHSEMFDLNLYEKHFEVKEDDIVFDAGASIGPFGFKIKDKNPKHIYCVEPSPNQNEILKDNLSTIPHTIIPYGIGRENVLIDPGFYGDNFGDKISVKSKPFMEIINENNIKSIDFLKTDCEGGEYDIFSIENLFWIKENVGKIAGEWHLSNPELKEKFRFFRDTYLRLFPNHMVSAVNGTDIKWDLWNDHFIEYYRQVIIYIDNK